jgi:hypothetical protein
MIKLGEENAEPISLSELIKAQKADMVIGPVMDLVKSKHSLSGKVMSNLSGGSRKLLREKSKSTD